MGRIRQRGALFGTGAALLAAGAMAAASVGGVSGASTAGRAHAHRHGSHSHAVKLPGGFGSIPAASGKPAKGGTVAWAEQPGAGPNYIFPVTPAALATVYDVFDFQYLMWRPLYWQPRGATPAINTSLSLAKPPVFSDGNKTVTIHMDTNYHWSTGAPVDANDVVFMVDLLKAAVKESPANSGNYTPGFFPDNVKSMSTPNKDTVVMHLTKAYNPGWFYNDQLEPLVFPLPSSSWNRDSLHGPALNYRVPANAKKIYDFLNKQSKDLGTYAKNPLWQVVDGPFHLTSFTASNDAATLAANKHYTGPHKPHIAVFKEVPFTSDAAEFNQLRSGTLTAGYVDPTDLPQAPVLQREGYSVFGLPDFGFDYAPFNFKDKTGHWNKIIGQLYVRRALAMLENQPGYVKGIYRGAAVPAYGVTPQYPASPYQPKDATHAPDPYSPAKAAKLLRSHGWMKKGGVLTCERAGAGHRACGAGIPKGTKLAFNFIYANSPTPTQLIAEAFASEAKTIGIDVSLTSKTFNFMLQNYNDVSASANDNKWAMMMFGGFTNNVYPTTNTVFNTTGSYNLGGFSSPKADKLIHTSVYGASPIAVKAELSYLSRELPGLFMPARDRVFAWKNTLSGPPSSFATLSQLTLNPEEWYFKK